MDRKSLVRRVGGLIVIIAVVLVLFLLRLMQIQLVQGETHLSEAEKVSNYKFRIPAARGEIVDAYGRPLATNASGYNLAINKLMLTGDLNEMLMELIEILQVSGDAWNDTIPVSSVDNGVYSFTDGGDTQAQKRLADLKTNLNLQQYATADQVMSALVTKYELADYPVEWQRILAGVRYQMQVEEFGESNNFVLAQDVSDRTVATVKERGLTAEGADITETSYRVYEDGTIAPHLLGDLGMIFAEQWRVEDENGNISYPLKDQGYRMNDLIGRSGLEKVCESRLRGTDGTKQVSRDKNGVIVSSQTIKAPEPGETVVVTINKDFQKKVNEILEASIKTLQSTKESGLGKEANAGAVVVIDVKTGGILAYANYPSYDLNLYRTNYSDYVAEGAGQPLLNRALQGRYSPGSTFKPVVAIAGITQGLIAPDDLSVVCTGQYNYYVSSNGPGCANVGRHIGTRLNVYQALQYSCNTYFYDLGRRLGVEGFDEVAQDLGLATATGVELPEAIGQLTHTTDESYTNGQELMAAIGQGNTLVTPVQLATYAATIANKGVRYQTHFISGYRNTNTGEMTEQIEPTVLSRVEDNNGVFQAVEQGMILAAKSIGALQSYPLSLAVKTGSPQRAERFDSNTYFTDSAMVAYGPTEDPEIAIGAVIEWGGGGANLAPLVRDIFNAYYFEKTGGLQPAQEGVLLP